MGSVFDIPSQHKDIDSKIVAALERISQVFRALLWEEAKEEKISPLQIQLLVYLSHHPPGFCRVSHLAKEFEMSQATISDAVTSLEEKSLVTRVPLAEDGRVSTIQLTTKGKRAGERLASWADPLKHHLGPFSSGDKERLMMLLMEWIASLQRSGEISVSRMCISCSYFRPEAHPGADAPHHCALLDKPIAASDLRIDCPDHEVLLV
ncbi:MAG: MarR family winged helix-turn-helix transcriptional regulator [Candidatus Manganitrophaceae bacterium]